MQTDRVCLCCGSNLIKREKEAPSRFAKRNFCNRRCSNAYIRGGTRFVIGDKIKTHKFCHGPLHPEGALLPFSEYYPIKDKRWPNNTNLFQSQCKKCQMKRHGYSPTQNRGHVPLTKINPVLDKLKERHGTWKAVGEATGISRKTIYSLRNRDQKRIHKVTAGKLIRGLNACS